MAKKIKTIDARRKRRVKELLQKGMELNDAIIESHKKTRNASVKVKLEIMKQHFKNAKEWDGEKNKGRCNKTRKKIEQAKRKRNRRKSPLIPIGFEYKKW
tara:strand:- start:396 stop:695 length:300 start_codon:yes stop_codon:yes gene_type:complete